MAERITNVDFEEKVLGSDRAVLVEFYSDSCVPCKRMSPVLSQLEQEYPDTLKVYKVNTGYEQELVDKYEIQSTPTFIFFRGGGETSRIHGAVPKKELAAQIEQA